MPTIVNGIGSLNLSVTGGSRVGNLITLTFASVPASVEFGQRINVSGVGGFTGVNGEWTASTVTSTSIQFTVTSAGGTYTSGGTVGRLYATPDAWNTATQGPIGAGNIKVGEMYADSVFEQLTPTVLAFGGATSTTATQYRMLRAWGTHYYKARLDSGVKIRRATSSSVPHVIRISEPFFRIQGIGIEMVDTYVSGTWVTNNVINCEASSITISACTVMTGSYHTAAAGTVNGIVGGTYCPNVGFTVVIGPRNANARTGNGISYGGTAVGRITNCTVYGFDNKSDSLAGGIRSNNAQLLVTNCAVFKTAPIDSGFAITSGRDINVPTARAFNCVVSDSAWSIGLSVGCVEGLTSSQELVYPDFLDLRPINISQLVAQKVAQVDPTVFLVDGEGNALPSGGAALVNIGAYSLSAQPQSSVAITVVEKTIGSGGDYATIAAWEADTDNHLVGLNQIQRGFLLDSSYNEQITISGAITDKRRYRELRYAGGNRYDALNNTGAYVYSAAATGAVIKLDEKYARLTGIKVESTYTGAAGASGPNVIEVSKSDCILDAVVAEQKSVTGSSTATTCFLISSATADRVRFRNCIALGNSNTAGASVGFYLNGIDTRAQNCLATRMRRTTSGTCFGTAVTTVYFENCFAGNSDIGFTTSLNQRYNASVDTTAAGVGSLTGVVVADAVQDATNGDFRLKVGSVLIDAGVPLDLEFTADVTGAKWTRPWNIGPYIAYVAPPMYPAAKTARTHRYCPIWKIQTNLGDELRIAGHDSNLYHNGELYEAQSGLDTTAYRAEGGLRDHQLEAFGFISSDRITYADLDAGIYQNAKVTMMLVDWRYPWLAPAHKAVFFLRRIRFDGEQWRAEAEGLTSVLKRTVGRVYSPLCPYQLGSPNPQPNGRAGCGVDISQFTEYDIEVASVVESRRVFRAKTTAPNNLDVTFADNYFRQGIVTWTTGSNIGRSADVVIYTSATREIVLAIEQPFPIVAGDRFNIVHGDDHTINTCKTRFGNEDNFGGDPYIPGSQRAYQTP